MPPSLAREHSRSQVLRGVGPGRISTEGDGATVFAAGRVAGIPLDGDDSPLAHRDNFSR